MSSIEQEIAAVKAATQKKLRLLRERVRKEQLAIDQRVIVMMRQQSPTAYDDFCEQARVQISADADRRSERARRTPSTPFEVDAVDAFDGAPTQDRFGEQEHFGGIDGR